MKVNRAEPRNLANEGKGWIVIWAVMVGFPILFFLCVFVPIWVGWTPAFP